MCAQTVPFVTPEEYLEFDRKSDVKNEYVFGEIVSMAGGTARHARIGTSANVAIGKRLASPCAGFGSNLRVCLDRKSLYSYPDALVICGGPEFLERTIPDTVTNPTLVVEVLSPTTRDYDLGGKLRMYQRVASMREVVILEQDKVWVEHWRRLPNGRWEVDLVEDPAASLKLDSVGLEVGIGEFYSGIEFT